MSLESTGDATDAARQWQVGVWDAMAEPYETDVDARFTPVLEHLIRRADVQPGQSVLDLGTGTGAAAIGAASRIGAGGSVLAVDVSSEMLARARQVASRRSIESIEFAEGRAEEIPAGDESQHVVLASLSLMYVIDRAAAAREIARVLSPGGRMVAAVWAGPEEADIVRFQQIAGSFAPAPPVEGVGPGSMGDPAPFLEQLTRAGLAPSVESEVTRFRFERFDRAWDVLAGVTAAAMDPSSVADAKRAIREQMWPDPHSPREFENLTRFIVAQKPS